ncbi:Cyclic nucleotide-binding domain protein [Maliponia aquimaris]|uniref:Cyclic nucleotide-binding domain protein n=2 Tax=Maliponia aquimaris TaxID=1673631 RepID=A0A238K4R7_9RHOB|nr:Cyclic nucleotide-binding domain protein [Maliponia aquimaris]
MIAIMPTDLTPLFSDGRLRRLLPGEALFHSGADCVEMFLLTSGRVDLIRYGRDGTRLRLHRATAGDVCAEASAYSDNYHCDGVADGPVEVIAMARAQFLDNLARTPTLSRTWAAQLARSLQKARLQSEIRTLRTVAERLDAYLADGQPLPPRGAWQDLAETLGISREALYRELARRRTGGTES